MSSSPTPAALTVGKVIRQSGLDSLRDCGLKWKYSLMPDRPITGSVSRAMGTAYHAGMETLYGQRKAGDLGYADHEAMRQAAHESLVKSVDEAVDGFDWTYQYANSRQQEVVYTFQDMQSVVDGYLIRYIGDGHEWDPQRFEVVGIEDTFSWDIPGHPDWKFAGTMDLVLRRREDGALAIIDHKTSKRKWDEKKAHFQSSPQGAFYTFALGEMSGVPATDIRFVHDVMSPTQFQRISNFYTESMQAALQLEIEAAIKVHEADAFVANPGSFLCSSMWCDYYAVCPFGAAAQKGN